jgi:hypothetical protein
VMSTSITWPAPIAGVKKKEAHERTSVGTAVVEHLYARSISSV